MTSFFLQPKSQVQLAGKIIGDGNPVFVVFEAGPTHSGLESAKRLIELAAEAGADAIKFQIFEPEKTLQDKKQHFSYEVLVDSDTGETKTISEPLYDIYIRRSLSRDEWREVKAYSDELGLTFFATADSFDYVNFLIDIGCVSIKIASCDVNHYPLIRAASKQGVCLQLDTGNATIGEIEKALDIMLTESKDNFIIHLCPSGYPARLESINLRSIPTMKQMFGCPIAFSDHSPGWDMDIAAVALGANLVEKTITTDRTIRSPEHIISLEPEEMKAFIKAIRDLEIALGESRKRLHPNKIAERNALRRSVHLAESVKKGTRLRDAKVEFMIPGYGIQPERYEELLDAKFADDLTVGKRLGYSDLIIKEEQSSRD
jgi:sialic acid synthase SpsE